jgi:hypothetical protein
MSSHPIDEYSEAYEYFKTGKKNESADKLSKSIGGDKATEPIKSSLDKIFDKKSLIHKSLLDTVVSESKRRENVRK